MSAHPLLVLRQEIKTNPTSPLSFHNQDGSLSTDLSNSRFIKIGSLIFSKDCPTNFKSKRGAGPFYSLEVIAFLFSSQEISQLSYTDYVQTARKVSVGVVSIVDRKDLSAYVLNGNDAAAGVDHSASPCPTFQSFEDASNYKEGAIASEDILKLSSEPHSFTTRPLHSLDHKFKSSKVYIYYALHI
jgi:hypothetical protein